jgi:response regulator NasT
MRLVCSEPHGEPSTSARIVGTDLARRTYPHVVTASSDEQESEGLRVLVADGPRARREEITEVVSRLGHEAVAREAATVDLGAFTRAESIDLALVIVHEGTEQALGSIDRIVLEAACPVIAIIDVQDRAFVNEAAQRGVFAYVVVGDDPEELQSSMDIVLRRFREYHGLEGAFARRSVTERAKGILMERHRIGEREAYELLRQEARRSHRKLVDIADAVLSAHPLLPASEGAPASPPEADRTEGLTT